MGRPHGSTIKSRFTSLTHNTAFSSGSAVVNSLKSEGYNVDHATVAHSLSRLPAYVQHKRVVRRFRRLRTNAYYLDYMWQADLLPVETWAKENDGVMFLLTVKDIFSKFTWAKPLTDKSSKGVADQLQTIFTETQRTPSVFLTDAGKEFQGHVTELLKKRHIRKIESISDVKASAVEIYNRALKKRIVTYQTHTGSHRYIHVLPQLVAAINNTVHRAIKVTPASVNKDNESLLYYSVYRNRTNYCETPKHKYNVGDLVLVAFPQRTFRRGFEQGFGTEHFFIHKVLTTDPVTYKLRDYNNVVLQKRFYEPQLARFIFTPGQTEDVEELATRTRNGKKEVLIHFLSAPKNNTEWVPVAKTTQRRRKI